MVANRVSQGSNIYLVGVGPPLRRTAIPREADLTFASAIGGPGTDSDIALTALHDGEIVRGAFLARVGRVTEFKQGLRLPLPAQVPLAVAGETHAGGVEGRLDRDGLASGDVLGRAHLDHLE